MYGVSSSYRFLFFFTLYACVNIYIQFKKSKDRQYPSLIQSFHDQRCKEGAWLSDDARVQYVSTVLFLIYFILFFNMHFNDLLKRNVVPQVIY